MRPADLRRVGAAAALAAAALAVAVAAVRCGGPPAGPDVLLLVLDTTRADRCSFLGYARPTTPHLDAFAQRSVVFRDAWSPGSWTPTAHAALFTGRRVDRLGILGPTLRPLPADAPTLAELLRDEGWRTGCFTCNPWIAPRTGLTRGFQDVAAVYENPVEVRADEAHDLALAWMVDRRRAGERFLAFVNDVEPHTTWDPPAAVSGAFVDPAVPRAVEDEARSLRMPRTIRISTGVERLEDDVRRVASDLYDAEVATVDRAVGRLLEGMRAEGLLDGTLVVVASDHGEGLGDHGWLEHGTWLHRELLHVPLLVRPPGGVAPRVVEDVVRLEDVFPTVLEACGVAVPDGVDGATLLPSGDDTPLAGRVAVAAERVPDDLGDPGAEADPRIREIAAVLQRPRRSVYDGRWHLIEEEGGATVLYDVDADPGETRDVAAAHPDVVAALRAHLEDGHR